MGRKRKGQPENPNNENEGTNQLMADQRLEMNGHRFVLHFLYGIFIYAQGLCVFLYITGNLSSMLHLSYFLLYFLCLDIGICLF